ncbi:hypothetical protein J2T13_000508 [Paenibacillus sp. DS2015]|uniref:DUF4129 domain-containing transglutaminase family protein n=1 Tax=Paenibacillus sp. DS2015 TaxID=3373917 RepID=UPI003D25A49F
MKERQSFLKYDGFKSFSYLWIWIVASQWLIYTESIWYSETTALVGRILLLIAIIEILLPLRLLYRMIIQGILILFVIRSTLISHLVYVPYADGFAEQVGQFIDNLDPYVWFALMTWVLYISCATLVTTQRRILLFMGLNIAVFTILDSFTSEVSWVEVGWMIFSLMGWLVSQHLQRFKRRFPKGWRQLVRNPLEMCVHISLVFALLFLVGISMPKVNPVFTDPYTLWKDWNDTTDTESNNGEGMGVKVPSSGASGYSAEDNQLGSGFEFDYTPVMTVSSSKRSYWRGETRRVYTGTGWADKPSSIKGYDDVDVDEKLGLEYGSQLNTETVQQKVTMLNNINYPVLFGAFTIASVQMINEEKDISGLQWKGSQGELHWNVESKPMDYPRRYTITSEIPILPVKELQTKSYEDLYANFDETEYLQIPNNFPDRVTTLAKEITESTDAPFEKMALLQQYLQAKYKYTNTPDLSLKKSDDFVDSFLFEIQAGYCDYFSTAMAMMARSLDIPTRWVKGYAPGSQPNMTDIQMTQPNSVNTVSYTVTNADAHSWVEAYFGPDYGWIPIEATPGFDMALLTEQDIRDLDIQDEETEEEQDQSDEIVTPENDSSFLSSDMFRGITLGAILIVISSIAYVAWRFRVELHYLILRLRMGKTLSVDHKIMVETERWLHYLHKRGMTRNQDQTLREAVASWEQSTPELAGTLTPLLQLFEKARYSPEAVSMEDWRKVRSYTVQLKDTLGTIK